MKKTSTSKPSGSTPPLAGKEKKKISRLRTGCWTCRRRGYKCDEGKPHCYNCTRLNLACEGYGIRLKWQVEGSNRHSNKGKSKDSNPMSPATITAPLIPQYSFYVHQPPGLTSVFDPNQKNPSYQASVSSASSSSSSPWSNSNTTNSNLQINQYHPSTNHFQQIPSINYEPSVPASLPSTGSTPYSQQSNHLPQLASNSYGYPQQHQQQEQHSLSSQQYQSQNYNYGNSSQLSSSSAHNLGPLAPPPTNAAQGYSFTLEPPMAATLAPLSSNSNVLSPPPQHPAYTLENAQVLKTCLDHFRMHKESRIPVLLPDKDFLQIIEEYIPLHEPLAYAVASLAARSLSTNYTQISVDFKIKALNLLRHDLVQNGVSEYSIACMLVLGNIEMNEQRIDAWLQHLEGACKGVSEILASNNVFEQPENYRNFVVLLDAVAYQDIVSGISRGLRPQLHRLYHDKWRKLKVTDNYYNAIRPLISTISDIIVLCAELHEKYPTVTVNSKVEPPQQIILDPIPYNTPIPLYHPVDKRYLDKDQRHRFNKLFDRINSIESPNNVPESIQKMVSLCKYTLLLFYSLKLDSEEYGHKLSSKLREYRKHAIDCYNSLETSSTVAVSQTLVLWMVGITTETKEDQTLIMEKISVLYNKLPRLSLYNVTSYLNQLWKMREDQVNYGRYTIRDIMTILTERTGYQITL